MIARRILSILMSLLLVSSLPLAVLAEEYDLANGSITVEANDSGRYVTQENGVTNHKETTDTVIKQTGSGSTTNTITIDAAAGTTAEVTIQDVNINTSGKGTAGISTSGDGDVTIELEGTNSVTSDANHAGVEKNNTGSLTIRDEDADGSLTANGGDHAAGIGGAMGEDGDNITISGAKVTANGGEQGAGIGGGHRNNGENITISGADVTANGGNYGAGIGGGDGGSGSNITIEDSTVTANGGSYGAGIGGGWQGVEGGRDWSDRNGPSENISISNSTVHATGGDYGSGIGSGYSGDVDNITITDSEVTATGGKSSAGIGSAGRGDSGSITITNSTVTATGSKNGTSGAGIGSGWKGNSDSIKITGSKVNATGGKWAAGIGGGSNGDGGNIEITDSQVDAKSDEAPAVGAGWNHGACNILIAGNTNLTYNNLLGAHADGDASLCTINVQQGTTINGTTIASADVLAMLDGFCAKQINYILASVNASVEELVQSRVLYCILDRDGKDYPHDFDLQGSVLTLTADTDYATLTGLLSDLRIIASWGVESIVFVTNGTTSTFDLADLLAQASSGEYALTHDGATVTFTLDSGDVSNILK